MKHVYVKTESFMNRMTIASHLSSTNNTIHFKNYGLSSTRPEEQNSQLREKREKEKQYTQWKMKTKKKEREIFINRALNRKAIYWSEVMLLYFLRFQLGHAEIRIQGDCSSQMTSYKAG